MNKYNDLFYSNKGNLHINYVIAINLLSDHKVYRYTPDLKNPNGNILVRMDSHKVKKVGKPELKNIITDHINSNYSRDEHVIFLDKFIKSSNQLFSDGVLENLPNFNFEFYQDDKNRSYVFFRNKIVEISKPSINFLEYKDSKKVVWTNHVINRDIEFSDPLLLGQETSCEFEAFIQNACDGDHIRKKNMELTIGYLLHLYKNPSEPKAVILYDEQSIDNSSRADGRTGKGILIQAISRIRDVVQEDGKIFNQKSNFAFQQIEPDTQIYVLDDVGKSFDFERVFSISTQGIPVEKKYQSKIYISYDKSPKLIITSNYIIPGNGASHDARRIEIELSHHYNDKHRPIDDFGHNLFHDWKNEEWNRFYNYMLKLIQMYLREGLNFRVSPEMKFKKLARITSGAFAEFCIGHPGIINIEFDIKDLFDGYKSLDYTEDEISQNLLTKWLQEYAEVFNMEFKSRKSNGKTFIRISK